MTTPIPDASASPPPAGHSRVRIEHRTTYRYDRAVSFSPHIVRLFPRAEPGRFLRRIEFSTQPGAVVRYRRDLFDNAVARCNYPDRAAELRFDFVADLEIQERNPFDFLLENYAAEFPFDYSPSEAARLAPYLRPVDDDETVAHRGPLLPLPFWKRPDAAGGGTATVSLLGSLLDALHGNLGYERRDTGRARPPGETLTQGAGACRDFAVLLAAILRELGLAARLVSGYLCEFETASAERRAEAAMHAWTEVYLPGAGWVGLDPTNGVFCNHHHLATAVGLTPADITPISGTFYSDEKVTTEMTATILVSPL